MISHPHYYTTYATWSQAFKCPVYISVDDQEWLCQTPPTLETLRLIKGPSGTAEEVLAGVKAIKTGGHFPGSLVLHWENKLFIADTIVTVPVSPIYLPTLYSIPREPCERRSLTYLQTKVRLYAPPPSTRPDKLLLPMVNPEHDPAAAFRDFKNLACH